MQIIVKISGNHRGHFAGITGQTVKMGREDQGNKACTTMQINACIPMDTTVIQIVDIRVQMAGRVQGNHLEILHI